MEKIKLYIDNATGEVYYSPSDEIATTIIEVDKVPEIETQALHTGKLYYIDGVFSTQFEVDNNQIYGAINDAKAKLADTDYQVLKMIEAKETGKPMPYSQSIYSEREGLRVEINTLEAMVTQV